MKNLTKHSRLAGAAIAAVLALGSSPSAAQEAGTAQGSTTAVPPVVLVSPVSTSPAPAPGPTAAPTQDPQLLTRLAPEPPTNVRADPKPSRTRRAAARIERAATPAQRAAVREVPAAAPASAAHPPAPGPVTPVGDGDFAMPPIDSAPAAAYEPLPPAPTEMAEPPAPVVDGTNLAGILAALLAIAMAGVGGFLVLGATRRRRQRLADIAEPVRYEVKREPGEPRRRLTETGSLVPEAPAPRVRPVAPEPYVPTAAALAIAGKQEAPKAFVATWLAPATAFDVPISAASHGRATAATQAAEVPQPVPTDPEELEELIQQMVEAEPDPVNPFQSRKARRKRARLILQSLHRGFGSARPNFDIAKFCRDWNIAPPRRFSRA